VTVSKGMHIRKGMTPPESEEVWCGEKLPPKEEDRIMVATFFHYKNSCPHCLIVLKLSEDDFWEALEGKPTI
jgi:hypothetical protein